MLIIKAIRYQDKGNPIANSIITYPIQNIYKQEKAKLSNTDKCT